MQRLMLIIASLVLLLMNASQLKAESPVVVTDEQLKSFYEEHQNSALFKIFDDLSHDDQFQLNVAIDLMIIESMKHKELLANPFLFFTTLLSHESSLAVGGAARGLGKLKENNSLPYLLELIKKTKNDFILESSVLAIAELNSKSSPDILFDVLMSNEENNFVKESAIRSLVKIEKEGSVPRVIKFLKKYIRSEKTYSYVHTGICAIGLYQNKDAIDMLIRILYDNKIYNGYRITAAIELEQSKSKRANLALKNFLLRGQEPELEAKINCVVLSRKECK